MKIINRTDITNKLTDNLIKAETGLIPMLVTNPVILCEWYHVNRVKSELLDGVGIPPDSVISDDSTIVFDRINNCPIGGVDNLLMPSTYDDGEGGWTTDYSSNGFVFANTVNVTENDYFVLTINFNGIKHLIFKIREHKRDHVKNMSIIEFDFELAHDSEEKYNQLQKQVNKIYTCISSKIGSDSSFIIEEEKFVSLEEQVEKYIEVVDLYKDLFYDSDTGAFMCQINIERGPVYILDRVLNKIMTNNEILYFDRIILFARSEFNSSSEALIYEFDESITNHTLNTSIIQQLLNGSIKEKTVKVYPQFTVMEPTLSKYHKVKLIFIDRYDDIKSESISITDYSGKISTVDLINFYIFDEDFISRIKNNQKYDDKPLRNVIIDIYNGTSIDYEEVELEYERTVENFYLIPIILNSYAKHLIETLNN